MGHDVAIMLDNLTRLTRAYNLAMPASGKILTGGIDSAALYPPRGSSAPRATSRRAARSRSSRAPCRDRLADGRGDLRRVQGHGQHGAPAGPQLAEKRLFPAINVDASSTRKEELLLPPRSSPW
jgi:transcription termination factor Rho